MKRRTALILFILTLTVVQKVQAETRPRYTPGVLDMAGKIELEQYFQMPDLREAARLLLAEAQLANIHVDSKHEASMPEILLPSGRINPSSSDRSFFATDSRGHDRIVVLRFRRPPTIRELAELMRNGIRLYRGILYFAYVARVPPSSMAYVSKHPVVDWACDYLPSNKYDKDLTFEGKRALMVYSLPEDRPESREDLERLGCVVEGASDIGLATFEYDYYVVTASAADIPRIADLWWVQQIELVPQSSIDE